MSKLKNKLFVYFTILGIIFTCSFFVNGATPTPTRRLTPTSARRVTPTPTRRRIPTPTRRYVVTFYIEKVSDASEQGPKTGQFRLWSTQSGSITGDGWAKVNYTISGTASNGVDYKTLQGYVYVLVGMALSSPPGDAPNTYINIDPIVDSLIEGTETMTITLTGVTVGAGQGSATLNITDLGSTPTPTATPTPTVTPTPTRRPTPTPTGRVILNPTIPPGVTITYYVSSAAQVSEPLSMYTRTSFSFWSTQTGPTTSDGYYEVRFTVGGTATSGVDYIPVSPLYSSLPGRIWVKVGNPPVPPVPTDTLVDTATIMIRPDNLVEGTETIIVTLTGVTVGPGQGSTTLNILDGTSPPPTATATPTPTLPPGVTPTPTPRPSGYVVAYAIQSDWGTGATVNVTITNNSTAAVSGWTLAFSFPGNQTITNLWNGTYTQTGQSVSVKDGGSNANIAANGGSVNFGFNLSYNGANAKPASFTLNGTPCTAQ